MNTSPSARFARAKFSREFDNARLDYIGYRHRRRRVVAQLDAEGDTLYQRLDDILRIIGQSLAELEAAA